MKKQYDYYMYKGKKYLVRILQVKSSYNGYCDLKVAPESLYDEI